MLAFRAKRALDNPDSSKDQASTIAVAADNAPTTSTSHEDSSLIKIKVSKLYYLSFTLNIFLFFDMIDKAIFCVTGYSTI